ncbi:MAG TPA: class I SAM-dependent methyltransferase [Leadbetterella sp.]|nr:class I SAM-dependent methyltransferase [Leadbetterella sp.]
MKLVANQAVFNQTLVHKIPEWSEKALLAPAKISLEQCSSQATAAYKAENISGTLGIDLTGGLGVDAYFFAKKLEHFIHNELNPNLSKLVKKNFGHLNVNNIAFRSVRAEEFEFSEPVDFIYLDPARRDAANRKMVSLSDCQPNLLEIKDKLLENAAVIMVKYSPMLDIKDTLTLLKCVKEVIILAERNEVKELVFILKKDSNSEPNIKCVNLGQNQEEFCFKYAEESQLILKFKEPQQYLYEPNAAIMKAGGFKSVAKKLGVDKLAANSHLYTSNLLTSEFPGRIFEIEKVVDYDKKTLKNAFENNKANVSTRNFPYSPDEIKKHLGFKDGGDKYLFFTENHNKKKIVLICTKIQNTLK